MHTQIWDLRMYKNNVSQYPHIDEIKQTFLMLETKKQSKISMLQKDVRQIIR